MAPFSRDDGAGSRDFAPISPDVDRRSGDAEPESGDIAPVSRDDGADFQDFAPISPDVDSRSGDAEQSLEIELRSPGMTEQTLGTLLQPLRELTLLAAAEQRVRRPAARVDADAGDVLVGGALPLEGTDVPVLHRRVVAAVVMGVEDAHVAAARAPAGVGGVRGADDVRQDTLRELDRLHPVAHLPHDAARAVPLGVVMRAVAVDRHPGDEMPGASPGGSAEVCEAGRFFADFSPKTRIDRLARYR